MVYHWFLAKRNHRIKVLKFQYVFDPVHPIRLGFVVISIIAFSFLERKNQTIICQTFLDNPESGLQRSDSTKNAYCVLRMQSLFSKNTQRAGPFRRCSQYVAKIGILNENF